MTEFAKIEPHRRSIAQQRACRTALDHVADLAGRSVVDDDPRPALIVEHGGEPAQAFGGMDTERGFPGDLDPVVRVRTLDRRRVARLLLTRDGGAPTRPSRQ